MSYQKIFSIILAIFTAGCISMPATVAYDPTLPFVDLGGYKFHVRTFGNASAPPVIVVHGGPGGDLKYLLPIQDLAKDFYVIYYDQRGAGLSPRVLNDELTLEISLEDLHKIVRHYAQNRKVKLVGHSWGAMLVIAYIGQHPELVSHVVAVEPAVLSPNTATAYFERVKEAESIWDTLHALGYIMQAPFVKSLDGHERFDFIMTKILNQSEPGGATQCKGQAMPGDAFARAGYDSFNNMLMPIYDDPGKFHWDLTAGIDRYDGSLLMLSSECSVMGYRFQQEFHLPLLPPRTIHVQAKAMGHNMLTLNPEWSVGIIRDFFKELPNPLFQHPVSSVNLNAMK